MKKFLILFFVLNTFSIQAETLNDFIHSFEQSGIVNDYAELLNDQQEINIHDKITSLQNEVEAEYAICLINDLKGYNVKDVAVLIGNSWDIGSQNIDKGILILISKNDREIFIATTDGIQHKLSDSEVQSAINSHIIPYLKKDDYYNGIMSGIDEFNELIQDNSGSKSQMRQILELVFGATFFTIIMILQVKYGKFGNSRSSRGYSSSGGSRSGGFRGGGGGGKF